MLSFSRGICFWLQWLVHLIKTNQSQSLVSCTIAHMISKYVAQDFANKQEVPLSTKPTNTCTHKNVTALASNSFNFNVAIETVENQLCIVA